MLVNKQIRRWIFPPPKKATFQSTLYFVFYPLHLVSMKSQSPPLLIKTLLPLLGPDFPNEMPECRNRMIPEHARTWIAHDATNLLASVWLVAMYRALLAVALSFAKGASVQAMDGIYIKREAFVANAPPVWLMMVATIDLYHLPDHYLFSDYIWPCISFIQLFNDFLRSVSKIPLSSLPDWRRHKNRSS